MNKVIANWGEFWVDKKEREDKNKGVSAVALSDGLGETKKIGMFKAKGCRVFLGSKLIVTVWEEAADNVRRDGESWLVMRKRTKPERVWVEKQAINRAKQIAKVLNAEA